MYPGPGGVFAMPKGENDGPQNTPITIPLVDKVSTPRYKTPSFHAAHLWTRTRPRMPCL